MAWVQSYFHSESAQEPLQWLLRGLQQCRRDKASALQAAGCSLQSREKLFYLPAHLPELGWSDRTHRVSKWSICNRETLSFGENHFLPMDQPGWAFPQASPNQPVFPDPGQTPLKWSLLRVCVTKVRVMGTGLGPILAQRLCFNSRSGCWDVGTALSPGSRVHPAPHPIPNVVSTRCSGRCTSKAPSERSFPNTLLSSWQPAATEDLQSHRLHQTVVFNSHQETNLPRHHPPLLGPAWAPQEPTATSSVIHVLYKKSTFSGLLKPARGITSLDAA